MQAVVQDRYGPPDEVLGLRDIDRPEPTGDEVLLRVRASAVAGDDWHLVRGLPYVARLETGLRAPKNRIPGRDLAGCVEAVGRDVPSLRPGDEVFGWCEGAFAELAAVPERALAPKPTNLTFEEAGVVPVSGFTALQALRDAGRLRAGQRVLIVGASGGVGTFAVQIAKALGAHVTGVCGRSNVELVRSLGADHVVDYRQEDYTRSESRYDVVVDLVANRSLADSRRVLAPDGTLVLVGSAGRATVDPAALALVDRWFLGVHRWIGALVISTFAKQRLRPLVHTDSRDDLLVLKDLIEQGRIKPVVSAVYPLARIHEAMAHFEAGHARGKVAIRIPGADADPGAGGDPDSRGSRTVT